MHQQNLRQRWMERDRSIMYIRDDDKSINVEAYFVLFLLNKMDDSDPPRSYKPKRAAGDKKKKYVRVDKKEDYCPLKFTQVPAKPPSSFDFSSIRRQGTASITSYHLEDSSKGHDSRKNSDWWPQTQEPETYQNCKDKIDDKSWLNVLKKYVKKAFSNAKNIEILYTSTKPSLMFHFSEDGSKDIKKIPLKDIIKANKHMGRHEAQTIEDIFDRLYFRVGEEFHKIMQLVSELADMKRVDLNLPSEKSAKIPLLYYCINKRSTNFTLFDRDMWIFEFSGHAIKELSIGSRHQKLCKKFEEIVQNKRRQQERVIEQYGEYEASSSDEEPTPKLKYCQKGEVQAVKKHLWKILDMNLDDYEDEIAELEKQYYDLQRRDDYKLKAQLEKLADDLGELQSNLENFKQTAEEVEKLEQKLRPSDIKAYKNLLKKMILAKRQLQNKLPITAKKREIFSALDKEDLVILEGETGSGKSTQLPQMMCEYFRMFDQKGKATLPILITQPRKLATRTVAERVASEMEEKIGGFVDYATSPHRPVSKTARIVFKMDALVLDEITADRLLSKYSCLIIDQAHERTISIDVILGLIKELQTKRKGFKVIVTSASLDARLFSDYFRRKVMKVSGRLYPVEVIHKKLHETDAVRKIEKVIKDDILVNGSQIRKEYKGDVLVFCSGVDEINTLCNIFQKYVNPRVFQVYPLHGRIAPSEQRLIFLQTKEHKLIFASRIAETSITINGVKVVVDPGFDREEVYDQKNRVSSRKLVNISQSSAKQRAGRAGRTSKGYCFRLYTQAQMQTFRPNKTPEIENMALDTLVLRLKMLNVQEIFKFAYVNKPDDKALEKSVETLQMIGALSFTGEITTVGKLLLQLRIEPFLGRAIVQAIICQQIIKKTNYADKELRKAGWQQDEIQNLQFTRQSIVEILSMVINSSNVFTFLPQFEQDRDNMDEVKFKRFSDQRGDFFYLLNIYDEYLYHLKKQKPHELYNWLRSRYLNKKTLNQVKELVTEINETVKKFNFNLKDPSSKKLVDKIKVRMSYCKNADDVILSCMMTSFCVNLCLYSNNPNIGYTLILQKKPVAIYGTSTLALLSKFPKWIICYDLKTNDKGVTYCQIAHEVDYEFMKRTVDDQVFEKLNLIQAEKMNPFYQTVQRQLPTLILYEIHWEFLNRHQSKKQIFKYFPYLSLILNQETNSISISWSKQLRIQDINHNSSIKDSSRLRQQFQRYIDEKILEKREANMSFHLISNVNLQMSDGFVVKSVYFTSKEVDHQVQADQTTIIHLKNFFQSQNFRCKKITRQKIKISTIYQEQYDFLQSFLYNNGLNAVQRPRQKRQAKLNAKIYMHINTGWKKDSNVYMGYPKQKDNIHKIHKILQQAKKRQRRQQEKQYLSYIKILCQSQFRIDKNQAGILCINPDIDAFQLEEAIQYLVRYGILPWDFEFPQFYNQYRDTDHNLAIKSEKEWQKGIEQVFESYGFKNISIKVKCDDSVRNKQQLYNMERMIKNKLVAQLSAQNIQVLDKLIKTFDGYSTIGAGRNHFRYNFKQFITKVNVNAFRALQQAFDYQKLKFQGKTAQLRIQTYHQIVGKVPHIFIKCRSPDRERLIEPSETIKQLFMPFILRLQPAQFNLLTNSAHGEYHLQDIQGHYNYQIYFGPDKKKNQLKIYFDDGNIDQITQRIMGFFERYDIYVETISYRGKGLNRVINLIEKEMKYLKSNNKTKSNQFLEYKIIFKYRQIELEGDAASINKIKGHISSLVNEEPGSCHICMRNTQRPYRLFNCDHSFCWKCLGDYLQQSRKDETNQAEILCPEDNCYKPISSYDMRYILSTEEFQQFSFKRLREYVNKSKSYFFCPTSGCDQLFEGVSVAKEQSVECFMCGKWYCSQCKQPHQHFTCTEWATKLANGQLKKYGFMQCKCGAVLQKEVKENIIQCKQCRQYLCWACIKGWKLQRDCINHIQICNK